MRISRGYFAILLVAICLGSSSALPDFLRPFKTMFGIKGSGSNNSPFSKPISSNGPSSSQGGSQSEDGPGFASDFGFGKPPIPQSDDGPSYGPNPGVGSPYSSGGIRGSPPLSFSGSRPGVSSSRPVRQQPASGYRPGPGFSSSSFGGRPGSSSSPFGGSGSRDHFPRPQGPPSNFRGQGHQDSKPYQYKPSDGGPGDDDDGSYSQGPPNSYQGGPGGSDGPSPFSYGQGPPSSSSPYGGPQGGPQGGPPRGRPGQGPRPFSSFQGSSNDGPSSDGDDEPQGPGFSGFGSFPSNAPEDDDGSQGPPAGFGSFGGPEQGSQRPYQSSRPGQGPSYESSSSPQSGFSSQDDDGPPSGFFGGASGGPSGIPGYPEQYEGGPRGTRNPNPQIISGSGGGRYPSQVGDEDDQGGSPQGFGGFGGPGPRPFGGGPSSSGPESRPFGGPSSSGPEPRPFGGGPSSSSGPRPYGGGPSSSPQQRPLPPHFGSAGGSSQSPWSQAPEETPVSSPPYGAEDSPISSNPPSIPSYQQKRLPVRNMNSFNSYSNSNKQMPSYQPQPQRGASPSPYNGGYQGSSSTMEQFDGKPMMMSASSSRPEKTVKVPRRLRHRKRYSAKISGPRPIPTLNSPQDPEYQPNEMPYDEPETAASGHGHGGHEGLSHNGDRILYHVSGHHGPHSYRFGYDTGKGKNRLFRFEEKDGKGYVKGKYGFYDKHGKLQVIKYEAHPKHGFHAERGH